MLLEVIGINLSLAILATPFLFALIALFFLSPSLQKFTAICRLISQASFQFHLKALV